MTGRLHLPILLARLRGLPALGLTASLAAHGALAATVALVGFGTSAPRPFDPGPAVMVELVALVPPSPPARPAQPAPKAAPEPSTLPAWSHAMPARKPAAPTPSPQLAPQPAAMPAETAPVPTPPAQTAFLTTFNGNAETEKRPLVAPAFRLGTSGNPLPPYPRRARQRGIEGTVILHVRVDAEGRPLAVAVAESSRSAALDRAALQTVQRWRFQPARRGLKPITATVEVPIAFRLTN